MTRQEFDDEKLNRIGKINFGYDKLSLDYSK